MMAFDLKFLCKVDLANIKSVAYKKRIFECILC